MKITAPGIYKDFDEAEYYADPCPAPSLTQSVAKVLLDQSLLHAKEEHPRLKTADDDEEETEKYSPAQAIGTAAHKTLIGRGRDLAICDFDDWKTKEARAVKAKAIEEGKTPILYKHSLVAHKMTLAARLQIINTANALNEPVLHCAFKEGDGEVVIAAEDRGDTPLRPAVWLRSLVDWKISPRLLFDYKTTGMSVAPHAIPNLMANAGWPIQAAMQERILDLIDPEGAGRRRFFFIAQENYKPFALSIHELPEGTMTMGRKMVDRAVNLWRGAIQHNEWPAYLSVIHKPEYPGWKESQWLNRELQDEAGAQGIDPQILMAG